MQRNAKILLLSFVLLLICRNPGQASTIFTVDQSNEPASGAFFSIPLNSPIGQEFTPSQDSLDVVEMLTATPFPVPNVSLLVNIRQGSIGGPVLGTSFTVFMPDNFVGMTETEFDFPSSVALVPGLLYVMQIQLSSGVNWGVFGGGPTYTGGRAIISGEPQSQTDLWFREGPAVPEPSSLLLVFVGLAAFGGLKMARRSRSREGRL